MVISHPWESDGGVERNPSSWKEPVKKSVQFFSDHKTGLRHQVSHLESWHLKQGLMKTSAWRRQRRPSTTELYWGFLQVDVDQTDVFLVDVDHPDVFNWSTSTILMFSWSTSPSRDHRALLRFSTGRRRQLSFSTGRHPGRQSTLSTSILLTFSSRPKYSNHLNTGHPNTGFIWILDTIQFVSWLRV